MSRDSNMGFTLAFLALVAAILTPALETGAVSPIPLCSPGHYCVPIVQGLESPPEDELAQIAAIVEEAIDVKRPCSVVAG